MEHGLLFASGKDHCVLEGGIQRPMTDQPTLLRREARSPGDPRPIVYQLKVKGFKGDTWRCSVTEFNRMLADMAIARIQRGGQR
jgi:hypothetical protein